MRVWAFPALVLGVGLLCLYAFFAFYVAGRSSPALHVRSSVRIVGVPPHASVWHAQAKDTQRILLTLGDDAGLGYLKIFRFEDPALGSSMSTTGLLFYHVEGFEFPSNLTLTSWHTFPGTSFWLDIQPSSLALLFHSWRIESEDLEFRVKLLDQNLASRRGTACTNDLSKAKLAEEKDCFLTPRNAPEAFASRKVLGNTFISSVTIISTPLCIVMDPLPPDLDQGWLFYARPVWPELFRMAPVAQLESHALRVKGPILAKHPHPPRSYSPLFIHAFPTRNASEPSAPAQTLLHILVLYALEDSKGPEVTLSLFSWYKPTANGCASTGTWHETVFWKSHPYQVAELKLCAELFVQTPVVFTVTEPARPRADPHTPSDVFFHMGFIFVGRVHWLTFNETSFWAPEAWGAAGSRCMHNQTVAYTHSREPMAGPPGSAQDWGFGGNSASDWICDALEGTLEYLPETGEVRQTLIGTNFESHVFKLIKSGSVFPMNNLTVNFESTLPQTVHWTSHQRESKSLFLDMGQFEGDSLFDWHWDDDEEELDFSLDETEGHRLEWTIDRVWELDLHGAMAMDLEPGERIQTQKVFQNQVHLVTNADRLITLSLDDPADSPESIFFRWENFWSGGSLSVPAAHVQHHLLWRFVWEKYDLVLAIGTVIVAFVIFEILMVQRA